MTIVLASVSNDFAEDVVEETMSVMQSIAVGHRSRERGFEDGSGNAWVELHDQAHMAVFHTVPVTNKPIKDDLRDLLPHDANEIARTREIQHLIVPD